MSGASEFPYPGNDPGQLTALHTALTTGSAQLRTLQRDTTSAATTLDQAWQGDSAALAHRKVATTAAAAGDLAPLLDRAATAVDTYRTAVTGIRSQVDDLRRRYDTLSQQLAGDEATARGVVNEVRSGDLEGRAATTASESANAAVTATSQKLAGLQTEYQALVRRNDTAASTCSTSFGGAKPPTSEGGEDSSPIEVMLKDTEGVRSALALKGAWDLFAGDTWVEKLGDASRLPGEAVANLDRNTQQIWDSIVSLADHPSEAEISSRVSRFVQLDEAVGSFSRDWAATSSLARFAPALTGASHVLTGLSVLGDLSTLAEPEDEGTMGSVDRGAALVNLGGMAASAGLMGDAAILGTEMTVPGVGEVAAVGTALYLGGDYLYHHWQPFHDVCDDVGHTTVSVVKDVGHGIASGWHAATSWL